MALKPHASQPVHPRSARLQVGGALPLVWGCKGGALLLVCVLVGCERSNLSDGLANTQDCSACHGSFANAAPPKAVNGSTETSDIGVGAHQAHLVAGHVAAPIACTECHILPTDLLSHPAQQSRPASVVFGPKASLYRVAPTWTRANATCADTYCHGAKLSGADSRTAPVWTIVDGRQRSCDSCHGNPPAGDHPPSPECHLCHGEVVSAEGSITDLTRHINGNVEFYVKPDAGAGAAGGAGAPSMATTDTGGSP